MMYDDKKTYTAHYNDWKNIMKNMGEFDSDGYITKDQFEYRKRLLGKLIDGYSLLQKV